MNLYETQAEALRELAHAHATIASHWSSSSRDALAKAQAWQSNPIAFEFFAKSAQYDGRTAELHRNLAQYAAHAADKCDMLAKRGLR